MQPLDAKENLNDNTGGRPGKREQRQQDQAENQPEKLCQEEPEKVPNPDWSRGGKIPEFGDPQNLATF